MPARKTLNRLQTLIWILVYGGLLTLVLGLSTRRQDDALGALLMAGGAVVAALGFLLIFVRARLHPTQPP